MNTSPRFDEIEWLSRANKNWLSSSKVSHHVLVTTTTRIGSFLYSLSSRHVKDSENEHNLSRTIAFSLYLRLSSSSRSDIIALYAEEQIGQSTELK